MTTRKFPGYAACIKMMAKRDPQVCEDGFHLLRPHAGDHVPELLASFQDEQHGHGLRCWLLELLGEARDPRAVSLFVALLRSPDERFRDWAARGLRELGTPEARRALYDAGFEAAKR